MPVDGTMLVTEYEPQAVFTGCLCPNNQQTHWHEKNCIYAQPVPPVKPTPYAGKRAWKQYKERSQS